MQTIELSQVLQEIKDYKPFDITYVRADRARNVAGKMRTYKGVVLVGEDYTNSIRRVKLPNGNIRPIHIRLIVEYNNKRVIY